MMNKENTMKVARRVADLPPYLFVEISKKIAEKRAKGEEVISFAIGDPDMPTSENVIKRLCQAARDPVNHRYPETEGLPELRQAMADWYERRFGVTINPATEVFRAIGFFVKLFTVFTVLDNGQDGKEFVGDLHNFLQCVIA